MSRPSFVDDEAIAQAVATHWLPEIGYLPGGFGAHHWRATGGGTTLFVTLDELAPRHVREVVLALAALPPHPMACAREPRGSARDSPTSCGPPPPSRGPLAEPARIALAAHGDAVERYLELADTALPASTPGCRPTASRTTTTRS